MARLGHKVKQVALACLVSALLVPPVTATELKSETAAAFDRYIQATEEKMSGELGPNDFLVIDRLPEGPRKQAYAQLQQGQLYIEPLHTKKDGKLLQAPAGLIHHWVGVAFIPGGTLSRTLAVLQDYDNHKNTYTPDVRDSKLLERNGNDFKAYLQLRQKSLVTVIVNVNIDVQYTQLDAARAMSKSYSKRIAEVMDVGKPTERELPVGNDHGYIWRLYSYWRVQEKDGGVYIQVASVGLSRTIPWALSWLISPLVRSIPKAVLSDLLEKTRAAVKGEVQSHPAS